MMNKIFLVFGISIMILMNACVYKNGIGKNPVFEESTEPHRKSIVYSGSLPCENCNGAITVLRLHQDLTFTIESVDNQQTGETSRSRGTYNWKGKNIFLNAAEPEAKVTGFKLEDNKLIPLESSDTIYRLIRSESEILERYWKLTELNGKPIFSKDSVRQAHMMVRMINNRLSGNGGCNGFGGTYELLKANGIRFSDIFSTKMACEEIDYEIEFFNVLKNANAYSIESDTLLLKRSDVVLAKFIEQ